MSRPLKLTVFGLFGQTSSDEIEVSVPSDCTAPEDGDIVFVKTLPPYTVWVDVNGEEVERPATAAVTYTWIDDRGVEVSRTIDDNVDFIVVASDTDYLVDLDLPVGWNEVACDDVVDRPELDGFDHNFGTGTFPSGTRPIIHTVCGQQDAPDGFSDVPSGHPFVTEIGWLVGEGITTGFPDGTFRPTVAVSRQAAAAFLYRLAGEPEVTGQAGFADVPVGHPFHDEIAWLVGEGITTGFPDDTFRPTQPVTRQAAAAFLYRFDGEPAVSGQAGFADVPEGHPFESEIAWLVGEGITTGFPDDTFRPVNDVTRQAMAAFLYRYGGGVEVIAIAQCINLEPVIVVSAVTGEIDGVPVLGALPEGTYTLTGDLDVTLTHEELNVGVLVEPRAYEFTISGDAIRSAQLQADLSECVATA